MDRSVTPSSAEKEISLWFKDLRKRGANLTQAELAKRTGIPLGSIRHFEQTGHIGFSAFLTLAKELDVLHLFLSLARNEEPETFHKVTKEKAISRLQDRLALATGKITPEALTEKNTRLPEALGKGPAEWRVGNGRWIPARNHQHQNS